MAFYKYPTMTKKIPIVLLLTFSIALKAYLQTIQTADILKTHVHILASDSLEGRGLGTAGHEKARNYILSQFEKIGLKQFGDSYLQEFSFRLGIAWISGKNILGYIEGSDPWLSEEFIVIGAHYDHLGYSLNQGSKVVFPGADDNASGVAAMIEIARYFAENPGATGRSLIFIAFDAEESGLRGSRFFTGNSPVDIHKIRLMFSLDMVGMYNADNGVRLLGISTLGNGESFALKQALKTGTLISNTSSRIELRTDTAPFGEAGIPAVHVFTGMKSPYHKPGDKPDLLDYVGMAVIVDFMSTLIEGLSFEKVLLPAPSLEAFSRQYRESSKSAVKFGFLYNTGTGYHSYKDAFFRANSVFAFSAGLFSEIPLTKTIRLQPEVLYDFNGSSIFEGKFRRHSLTIPVNIQIGTRETQDIPIRFFVFGGGYYRYNLAGKSTGEKLDFDGEYYRDEWGYNAGVGLSVFKFSMSYTVRRALTEVAKNSPVAVFDRNQYLTVGYNF